MRWTVSKKIVVLGLIPTLAAIFFLYMVLIDKIRVKADVDVVNELCQYVIQASKLVHELQKERGASAVYVGSGGNKMRYYTATIQCFIQSFENVTLQANHPQLSTPVSAFVNFISAKELDCCEG